jgi:1-hydroxycarotenoid 3,4-desaturase
MAPQRRSLSAITWAMHAQSSGFPLSRHNVFFARDYAAEFDSNFARSRLAQEPTVYVCAQDRSADDIDVPVGKERLLCLVNAPATGDTHPFSATEIEQCAARSFGLLAQCGLTVDRTSAPCVTTTPQDFAAMFPATGGALYGPAVHGAMATFRRPGSRTKMPGLYLAGGSTHPGAGVPMAALSGRLAAASVIATGVSTRR